MAAVYFCDNCKRQMQPGEERQQRFLRGDVEIVIRAHWRKRQPQSCNVCLECIRRAVNEPDPKPAPMQAPPGMVALGGSAQDAPSPDLGGDAAPPHHDPLPATTAPPV